MVKEGKVHPDCINASNPYHECVDYCTQKIAEAKDRAESSKILDETVDRERTVHPHCINASNPYHDCNEFCFRRIAERKEQTKGDGQGIQRSRDAPPFFDASSQHKVALDKEKQGQSDQKDGDDDGLQDVQSKSEAGYPEMNERQKKMFELMLKRNEAKKANQLAMMAEKKKMEAPTELRGISKQKWIDERKKKIGKLLDSNGLDMSKAYMLDTQEAAEAKYKKWEKEPAPFGWDVFNQKTLYDAYKKRTKNIECDLEAYNKAKEADPEFYREASSLQYGKALKVPEENIDRMVKELQDRSTNRKSFSRRRKFHEEKDIDSINDRNEHFNKKIERAFGKYTLEIKNNLERGTALPD